MSALEWLNAVRADLRRATPGPWDAARPDFRFPAHVITGGPSNTDLVATNVPERDARLIASAPDRLDRMERALRGVMEMHRRSGCREPWDTCPTMAAIEGALSDE